MTDYQIRLALKARLPRTWAAFFEQYGNFTAAQLAAIPAVLDQKNVVLCAPTAYGKTEAAAAPLIELHDPGQSPQIGILYLTPTRALANDLMVRLAPRLERLRVSLAVKTRDQNTFNPRHPAHFLISTPESVDSLLTSNAQVFAHLRAVVIDELHLFDGTARGDQLRVLLNRLRYIHDYAQAKAVAVPIQFIALSATLPHPEVVAARYFPAGHPIQIAGTRAIQAEMLEMQPDSAAELISYLTTFRSKGWRKAIIFCNSRAEVETYTAAIRQRSPFGNAVYAHYSNLTSTRRREIEEQFGSAEVAICCATSTLELGIDIGNIDVVILIGPPGSSASFFQRIGRGSRRQNTTQIACFYRSPLEKLIFETLLNSPDSEQPAAAFRPSVAIQQIFSLLKQSPTGSLRLNELTRLFDGMVSRGDLEAIVGELQIRGYLKPGRPGEWKPDSELNHLFDQQGKQDNELSIYSNIQSSDKQQIEIRNQHTQQTVAQVDIRWLNRPTLTLEGRPIQVEWVDGEAIWVKTAPSDPISTRPPYRSTQKQLSYDLARQLPLQLGFSPAAAPMVAAPEGWLWFHWLGDLYGRVLLDLLSYREQVETTAQPGLCLWLKNIDTFTIPHWTIEQIESYLRDHYRSLERWLDLGPFHHLLPPALRQQAVKDQFDGPHFLQAIANLHLLREPATDLLQNLL